MTAHHLLTVLTTRENKHAENAAEIKQLWKKFGLQVRRERKRRGIKLADFAAVLGVSGAMVSYMESGVREWSEDRAKRAVEVLTSENT